MRNMRTWIRWGFILYAGFLLGFGLHRARWYDFYWIGGLADRFVTSEEEKHPMPYWQLNFFANEEVARNSCEDGLYAALAQQPLLYVCPQF